VAARHYDTSPPKLRDDSIVAHIVSHSHDDVGWLKTVDEYYTGLNNSIQRVSMKLVLDSIMVGLDQNADRKFIFVESAFFARWWDEQDTAMKTKVHNFVKNGQLEFINGGWCMNDEATCHYQAIIDQMTVGHEFLMKEFGIVPTTGWQIDPFGHSSVMSSLFALMGFDSEWFARIDYQDKTKRLAERTLETMWRGSRSLDPVETQTFTGAFYGWYGPPTGFNWEIGSDDPPIQDDPHLFDYNVEQRINEFVNYTLTQAEHMATRHIMFTMGSDFQYENANSWYSNLDKLIHYLNLDGRIQAMYSTPTLYTKALNAEPNTWPVKTDDYFPYANDPHSYWSGYFTSRPAFKGYCRFANQFLQASRQLERFVGSTPSSFPSTAQLTRRLGVAQHHDAITGNNKQHVADDYVMRVFLGYQEAERVVTEALTKLTAVTGATPDYSMCRLLNETQCDATEGTNPVVVVIHNSLMRTRTEIIRVPVQSKAWTVQDTKGNSVVSQVVDVPPSTQVAGEAPHMLFFQAELPLLGFTTYFVSPTTMGDAHAAAYTPARRVRMGSDADVVIKSDKIKLTFSGDTGLLTTFTKGTESVSMSQNFLYWNASAGNNAESGQPSGAYIFRPNGTKPFKVGPGTASLTTVIGPVVSEVRQTFGTWTTQAVRVYRNASSAEFEWTVGPIPIDDGNGKEVISRFSTNVATDEAFYTDGNGREMQPRKINYRPTWDLNVTEPVADNYMPCTTSFLLKDTEHQVTVLMDRAQACASQATGAGEFMVHRRLLYDDYRGAGEALNETGADGRGLVVRGVHWVSVDAVATAAQTAREDQQRLFAYPLLAFTPLTTSVADWGKDHVLSYSPAQAALPPNVELTSLKANDDGTTTLRLSHMYEVGEHPTLSANATVDLSKLFDAAVLPVTSVKEMALTGVQLKSDVKRLVWKTDDNAQPRRQPQTPANSMEVILQPMQIRTFIVS
jgi:hypothetical protein